MFTPLAEVDVGSIFIWSVALLALLLALFFAVSYFRRWLNSDDSPTGGGFSLSELRQLNKSGQMTDEEFAKAKMVLLGSVPSREAPPGTSVKAPNAQNPPQG